MREWKRTIGSPPWYVRDGFISMGLAWLALSTEDETAYLALLAVMAAAILIVGLTVIALELTNGSDGET